MQGAEVQPTTLIVLQPIARAFDFNHSIASLRGPKLDQIRQARAVRTEIVEQPSEHQVQVHSWNAGEGVLYQLLSQPSPDDEWGVNTSLVSELPTDHVRMRVIRQSIKTFFELLEPAIMESSAQ